jgi:hypothetical protein
MHDAADVATGDVDVDGLGTLVDVDGVVAVDEVLQGHIDVVPYGTFRLIHDVVPASDLFLKAELT